MDSWDSADECDDVGKTRSSRETQKPRFASQPPSEKMAVLPKVLPVQTRHCLNDPDDRNEAGIGRHLNRVGAVAVA